MSELEQAAQLVAEAERIGRSLAAYTSAERVYSESEIVEVLKKVVAELAAISACHTRALAGIVAHLQSQ